MERKGGDYWELLMCGLCWGLGREEGEGEEK
jgi:hypothetical protein